MLLFLPETILLVLIVVLLCLTLKPKADSAKSINSFMVIVGFVVLLGTYTSLSGSGTLFSETYRVDLFSQGFKLILALAFLCVVVLSALSISIAERKTLEYYIFLCSATLGMMMLTSSSNILSLYVSLELSSYSLYILSGLKQDRRSAESGVKYLIFGAATSGLLLWGLSLIAGLAGTTSLIQIAKAAPMLSNEPAFMLGLFFVTISFLFKLSGFPAHFWAPDVYESSASSVTAFIATASKAAAVAILIRFFLIAGVSANFSAALGILAFISMTLGNCVALVQQDVKRLLAYSSIAQAGYILVGLLSGSAEGYSSSLFYALAYVLMNTAAFVVVLLVSKDAGHDNPQLSHFDGLAERAPFFALVLLLSLLSLAGIPPLVGFTGKWILFTAAMEKGHWFLVLWGVLNSVVSLFYYLTLVKHAYLEKSKNPNPIAVPKPIKLLGLILFCALILLGIFPNQVITFAQQAISSAVWS